MYCDRSGLLRLVELMRLCAACDQINLLKGCCCCCCCCRYSCGCCFRTSFYWTRPSLIAFSRSYLHARTHAREHARSSGLVDILHYIDAFLSCTFLCQAVFCVFFTVRNWTCLLFLRFEFAIGIHESKAVFRCVVASL